MKRSGSIFSYILCALFAALIAVCSQIMIPMPFTPVPINLALLAVWVCGGVLGAKRGAITLIVYILLGAVGAPVFVGFNAGLGALAGPTGGYIIGYLPSIILFGLLVCDGKAAGQSEKSAASTVFSFLLAITKGFPAMAA